MNIGITISALFENLEQNSKCGDEVKDFVWISLIQNPIVILQGSPESCLGNSPLSKLELKDVLTLGLGHKKILIKKVVVSSGDNSSEKSQVSAMVDRGHSNLSTETFNQTAEASNLASEHQATPNLSKDYSRAQTMISCPKNSSDSVNSIQVPVASPLPPKTPISGEEGSWRTPTTKKNDGSSRKSTFTPYEQIRFEAGIAGVYINPKIKGAPESTRGRPLKRPRLVVFKSDKLKDPKWLETKKGTWHEYVAEAIASQIIYVENNTLVPQKRKIDKRKLPEDLDTASKKLKLSENLVEVESIEDQSQGFNASTRVTPELCNLQNTSQCLVPKSISSMRQTTCEDSTSNQENTNVSMPINPLDSVQSGKTQSTGEYLPGSSSQEQASSNPHGQEIELESPLIETPRNLSLGTNQNQNSASFRQIHDGDTSEISFPELKIQHDSTYRSPYLPSEKQNNFESPNRKTLSKFPEKNTIQTHQNHPGQDVMYRDMNSGASTNESFTFSTSSTHDTIPETDKCRKLQIEACVLPHESSLTKNSSTTNNTLACVASRNAVNPLNQDTVSITEANSSSSIQISTSVGNSEPSSVNEIGENISIKNPQIPFSSKSEAACTRERSEVCELTAHLSTAPKAQKNLKRKNSPTDLQDEQAVKENSSKRVKSDPKKRTRASGYFGGEDADLKRAAALQFPPENDRLICRYQGKAGNLLLSDNKQLLEFYPEDQSTSEAALIKLEVHNISQNPITSMAGSIPMELRIKALDESNAVIVHAFEYAQTPSASDAANNMRTKIVAGIVACKFRSGEDYHHPVEIKDEIQKPYICEKCSKRFKNQNGLEYHLSKAATTCNPNYDPKIGPGKRGRKRKLPHELKKKKSRQANHTFLDEESQNPDSEKKEDEKQASANDSNDSNSSDDSIIQWALSNATSGVRSRKGRPIGSPAKSGINDQETHNNVSEEVMLLRKIAEEFSENADQAYSLNNLELDGYENLIVSIIKANNNVFPGDKSLWYACIGAWLKIQRMDNFSGAGLVAAPEFKTCIQYLEDLIENRKLEKHNVEFLDETGKQIVRYIVSIPGTDLNSFTVRETHDLIKTSYPDHYIPSEFSPSVSVLERLFSLEKKHDSTSVTRNELAQSHDISKKSSIQLESGDSDSDYTGRLRNHKNNDISENSREEISCLKADNNSPAPRKSSTRVREKHLYTKVTSSSQKPPKSIDRTPKLRTAVQTKESQKAKSCARRTSKAPASYQFWKPASFLQNPKSGAWELPISACSKNYTAKSTYRSRYLPEPITYLQADSGTWSIRPFGHGATPIYSRPSRMTTGNPNGISYLEKKHSSFRPIMYPPVNNMVHCPLPLSKHFKADSTETRTPTSRKSRSIRTRTQKASNTSTKTQESPTKLDPIPMDHNDEGHETIASETPQASKRAKRYTTRQKSDHEFKLDLDIDMEPTHDSAEKTTKDKTSLSELEILSLFEPKKLGSEAARNPGLETLPASFGISNSVYTLITQRSLDYPVNYPNIEFIVPNSVAHDSDFTAGSWLVPDAVQYKSDNYDLRWDDQTALDLESIPYRDLTFALNIEETVPKTRRPQFQPSKSTRSKPSGGSSRLRCTRILTHLNVDFCGIGDGPEASAKFLGIPMAAGDDIAQLRKRNSHDSMSLMVEKRFIIAVVIIRALTGGIECLTDWVLVSLLFPKFSLNFIKGHWKQLLIRHKDAIDRLERDFQEIFVGAYESGEIPSIDYDNLQEYDWNNLVDWTINNIDTSFSHKPISIPSSRAELERRYKLEVLESKESWRDKCFETNAATYRRLDYASFNALAVPIRKTQEASSYSDLTDLSVAKSWIRAIALSPEDESSLDVATKRVKEFGEDIAARAHAELIDSKVIMQRSKKRPNSSNRSYEATELFSRPLRREVKPKCFRDANVFKQYLDSEFRSGKTCVRVDYMAWDGDVMVISNLLANGRIELLAVDVPKEKFGLTEGGYETKKIPRERLRFEVDIHPTSTYMFEEENEVVLKALSMGPPRGSQKALPVWYSVSETVIEVMWKEVFSAVAQVMALRAGVTMPEVKRIFTPTMEGWEVQLLLDWGRQIGLFQRLHPDLDGWIVGEWWWAYAMKLFAHDRFTTGQEVRYEPKDPFTMEGRHAG
ncbi:hypothetical protein K3495_g4842 [Podosphaera aphanis]|nr:hypothetical protein K3495_g4842 [Podosphaera aphanis]